MFLDLDKCVHFGKVSIVVLAATNRLVSSEKAGTTCGDIIAPILSSDTYFEAIGTSGAAPYRCQNLLFQAIC